MIGYCKDGEYMALVYEYMSEGTLQEHIAEKYLTWRQRLRIALKSAQGLEYLHKGCSPPLIHRDVKATNILLNASMEAKIADFGLSKAFNHDNDTHISTNTLVGTSGYVDPEYQATMQPTTKSDVYSFGVVLLELITRKPPILRDPQPTNIVYWARQRLAQGNIEGVVDPRMHDDHDVNSMWKATDIALKCTAQASVQRPTMTDIVAQLQESLELEEARAADGGDANGGYYTGGGSSDPYSSYNAYAADGQSTDVSQTNMGFEVEHNFGRVPTMPTGQFWEGANDAHRSCCTMKTLLPVWSECYCLLWFLASRDLRDGFNEAVNKAMPRSTRKAMAIPSWLPLLVLSAAVLHVHDQGAPDTTDCGIPKKSTYVDGATKLPYVLDAGFTDAGANHNVSAEYIRPSFSKRYLNVRSFPGAPRSCYTLGSLTPGSKYLLRATFMYGNYDGLGRPPVFDLHLGVNFWTTVNITAAAVAVLAEVIAVVPDDSVQGLVLLGRRNFGPTDATLVVRYPDDPYDRAWTPWIDPEEWSEISTAEQVGGLPIAAPSAVMQTAITPRNASAKNIEFSWDAVPDHVYPAPGYICIFHFAELQSLGANATRQFYITINGKPFYYPPLTPYYLFTDAVYNTDPHRGFNEYNVTLNATANSTLPPVINAAEVFSVISTANVGTHAQDVSAITAIEANYQLKTTWMGDPCVPKNLAWDGLSCSYDISGPPRITTVNLSSSGLSGAISLYFSKLTTIEYLDLSHNNLTRSIPDVLSQLPSEESSVKPQNEVTNARPRSQDCNEHGLTQLENRRFTYKELEVITNNFQRVLGRGGFGKVYDGFLVDGTQVAVKLRSESSNQGVREFLTEAQTLTKIHHKYLVSLIGYCKDGEYLALVHEYTSEGTLEDKLRGMPFLLYTAALQLTEKSDVLSFGVVLLEVITGQPPILRCPEPTSVVQWVRRLARGDIEAVVDARLRGGGGYDANAAWKATDVALKCTAQAPA
ncbi:Senescence-induced receptor-like serine/threonine-protein kinase [Dichanthelium oligosanthes]|uniref:non-specific serine/threonine protein kinase n=1 Tax=Dichanthelium oligosanthes TaxID=888268 RepID=A0A1E5VLM7_9POAL|nr:Senescence-induced receptor-like serine/threonine-protein kinase [Dichanthelium oligosanthes]